jgi:gamma-butyrobetaine dioxygenase
MISLDEDDEIVQVRFNRSVMEVLDVPSELMEDVYRAYLAFSALVRDPGIVARYRFVPGDVLVFNNWRVLHGRDSFDPSSGERHLQGCYAETDDMLSRIRVLERSP